MDGENATRTEICEIASPTVDLGVVIPETGKRAGASASNAGSCPAVTPTTHYLGVHAWIKRAAYAEGERLCVAWSDVRDCWGERLDACGEDFADAAVELYCRLYVGRLTDAGGKRFVRAAMPYLREGFEDSKSVDCI